MSCCLGCRCLTCKMHMGGGGGYKFPIQIIRGSGADAAAVSVSAAEAGGNNSWPHLLPFLELSHPNSDGAQSPVTLITPPAAHSGCRII